MIEEALSFLAQQAINTVDLTPVETNDPGNKTFIGLRGNIHHVPIAAKPRLHHVETIGDLICLANRFANEDGGAKPVVWYDSRNIVLVIDDNFHRVNTTTLKLAVSQIWTAILGLNLPVAPKYQQAEFIRFLRGKLKGAYNDEELLWPIRNVKFTSTDTQTGKVMRGSESMSRETKSDLENEIKPPEETWLETTLYTNEGLVANYKVGCVVEVITDERCFQLIPFPDEITKVQQLALDSIRQILTEGLNEDIPCYQGTP